MLQGIITQTKIGHGPLEVGGLPVTKFAGKRAKICEVGQLADEICQTKGGWATPGHVAFWRNTGDLARDIPVNSVGVLFKIGASEAADVRVIS